MNTGSILLWGFAATLAITSLFRILQGLGMTRMDLILMMGTIFTGDRDRAKVIGFLFQLINGWLFAFLYAWIFESFRIATWAFGMAIGLVHGIVVIVVLLPILPGIHPRMASDFNGPEARRQLEPPGFLGLNYGYQTPVATLLGHLIYGAILGAFYQLRPL